MKRRIEWAVLEPIFRGTHVHKGGLGSPEEAIAWLAALTITQEREDREHFRATDGVVMRQDLFIGWREIDRWHPAEDTSYGEPVEEVAR